MVRCTFPLRYTLRVFTVASAGWHGSPWATIGSHSRTAIPLSSSSPPTPINGSRGEAATASANRPVSPPTYAWGETGRNKQRAEHSDHQQATDQRGACRQGCRRDPRPSPTASGIGGMAEGQSAQPTERSESRRARPAKRGMPKEAFRRGQKSPWMPSGASKRLQDRKIYRQNRKTPVRAVGRSGTAIPWPGALSLLCALPKVPVKAMGQASTRG